MLRRLFSGNRCPIGVDLGAHSVRLLQLEPRGRELAAVAAASRPVPADLPEQGPQRADALANLLRSMLETGGFRGRHAVSCLPAKAIQYKNLRVPRMPAEELRVAVEWEAADRLHLGGATTQIQFIDAGEIRQGEETRQEIILLAAANALVEEHVQTLTAAGLKPVAIDAAPCALARLAPPQVEECASGARVILDVGFSSTKVLITRHGEVVFFKLIDVGGQKLDQTVAQHLNLSLTDAAELRRRLQCAHRQEARQETALFGSTQRDNVERVVFEALRATVDELAKEVGLCLRYYSVTFRGRRPESALLVGGEAYEPQLAKLLTEGAGVQVELARPLEGIDLRGVEELERDDGTLSEWAVATGLCLREPGAAGAGRSAA